MHRERRGIELCQPIEKRIIETRQGISDGLQLLSLEAEVREKFEHLAQPRENSKLTTKRIFAKE